MDVDGARTPLIGRGAELEQIAAVVAAASRGSGRVLLVDGEAGIGKTRLVEAALDLAAGAGMQTFAARCDELESRRPFGAIAACLGVSARRTEPRHRHVARLLFEGPASEAGAVEALVVVVEEACEAGPLAIALDDLHWADPSSLLVLHRLAAAVDQLPLLVCGAYRPAPRPPELARLLRGAAARQATTLPLAPLTAGEVQALLSSVLGRAAGPQLARQAALAGGNPFYVTELVAALRASGTLEATPAEAEIPSVALPPALMFTVLLELSFLSEQVQEMLRAAAVLGSGFSVHDLSLVVGLSAVELGPAIREALDARVLREDGSHLSFRHDLLREAVYGDMAESLRRAMHLHAAGVLADHGASPLEVAEHFVRGASRGDANALGWLLRAADEATIRAPATAADLLEGAAAIFEPGDPGRDEVLADRAVSLETAARYEESERACADLLARPLPPPTEAKLRLCLARHLMRRGAADDAMDQAARAEAIDGLTPGQQARVLGVASTLPLPSGRLDEVERIARRGMAIAAAHGEAVAGSSCAFALASSAFHRGRCVEALELAASATIESDQVPGNRVGQGWRHLAHHLGLLRGQAWLRLDRHQDAGEAYRHTRRQAEDDGNRAVLVAAQSLIVGYCFAVGDWDDAASEFDALVVLCAETEMLPPFVHVGAGAGALVALHRGDPEAARAALSVAGSTEAPHSSPLTTLARALLTESADAARAAASALRILSDEWDRCIELGLAVNHAVVGPDLVRLSVAAGDLDRATAVCGAVDGVAAANPGTASLEGVRLRCRGLLGADPGLLVEAATVLGLAPRPLDHGLACEDAAEALARAGDLVEARRWLDEALRVYEQLDARWDAARATSRLRSAGVRRGSRAARVRPKDGWEALTAGERAVVELVAEGLSNPAVADRLFLSRNTVKTHLANAMRKVGLSSRHELAHALVRSSNP